MLASVVIPVYNRPDLLDKVLGGLVIQTVSVQKFEVLVCDDGSTDDLSAVIRKYKNVLPSLKHLHQRNQGPAAARNLGTKNASSEYVIYLDSDILPESNLIELFIESMERNPGWVGAEAKVEPIEGEDNLLWDAPICKTGGVYLTAAIIYRLDVLKKIGGLDQSFLRAACEDVELAVRALKHGKIGFIGATGVQHPRRLRTYKYYWNKRQDWRYVLYVAQRHGFIGWPGNPTKSPRMRLIWCALITQPGGRIIESSKLFMSSPKKGIVAISHAFFSIVCGLFALPELITSKVPPIQNYLNNSKD